MYIKDSKADAQIVLQLHRMAQRGARIVASATGRTYYPSGMGDNPIALSGHTAYVEPPQEQVIARLGRWAGLIDKAAPYLYKVSIRRGAHHWSGRAIRSNHPFVIWSDENPDVISELRPTLR